MIRGLLLALALVGCTATMSATPAGRYDAGAFSVALRAAWTRIDASRNAETVGDTLTRHGLMLGRVELASLDPGDALVRAPGAPRFHRAMSELALIEFVPDSARDLGFSDVRAENIRPASFGAADGLRFDLIGRYPSGLAMRGDALIAEAHGRLHVIVFFAPAEHYFDAAAPDVALMMDSVRFD